MIKDILILLSSIFLHDISRYILLWIWGYRPKIAIPFIQFIGEELMLYLDRIHFLTLSFIPLIIGTIPLVLFMDKNLLLIYFLLFIADSINTITYFNDKEEYKHLNISEIIIYDLNQYDIKNYKNFVEQTKRKNGK